MWLLIHLQHKIKDVLHIQLAKVLDQDNHFSVLEVYILRNVYIWFLGFCKYWLLVQVQIPWAGTGENVFFAMYALAHILKSHGGRGWETRYFTKASVHYFHTKRKPAIYFFPLRNPSLLFSLCLVKTFLSPIFVCFFLWYMIFIQINLTKIFEELQKFYIPFLSQNSQFHDIEFI